jgi:hypothetical protein
MSYIESARLWILVTDGHRARIVVPDMQEGQFRTMLPLGVVEAPYCPTQVRHEMLHQHSSLFTADVAGCLNAAADQDEFADLVLVGPATVTHEIRKALGATASARLVGALDKDYVALDDGALSAHLTRWWQAPPGAPSATFTPDALTA